MKIFTIDFTTFTKGASLIVHDSGDSPKGLGNTERPLDDFLMFSKKNGTSDLVIVKHFEGDKNADLIKTQLKTRGYNVQEFIAGGK